MTAVEGSLFLVFQSQSLKSRLGIGQSLRSRPPESTFHWNGNFSKVLFTESKARTTLCGTVNSTTWKYRHLR